VSYPPRLRRSGARIVSSTSLGDFAFVVWDEARRSLFCARDHLGVKPFHYYRSERFFACASE